MEILKFEKEAVLIKEGKIKAWMDVWIENQDVMCDWNQNVFKTTEKKDLTLKKWQDNLQNFEDASCLAVKTLEDAKFIFQDEKAKWHTNIK